MTEWQPQIVKISNIKKHPNANSLSIAYVMGDYPVIVKNDEYEVGELAAYIPIDSIVPDNETFYFLCPPNIEKYIVGNEIKQRENGKKYSIGMVPEKYRRIKAKKIRGVYSQGLLVKRPTTLLSEEDSIVDFFDLKKYMYPEERLEAGLPLDNNVTNQLHGNNEKGPSKFSIPYYDLEGLRKEKNKNLLISGGPIEVVLSEKIDGCNIAVVYDGERLWVKSRNFFKARNVDDLWWGATIREGLEDKLLSFPRKVFFGEVYGQVNPFRYDADIIQNVVKPRIRFFDIYDLDQSKFLDYDIFCEILKTAGLLAAPELYRGVVGSIEDINSLYSFAEGNSVIGNHIREGFVIRPVKEICSFERVIFKLKGEGYNLLK